MGVKNRTVEDTRFRFRVCITLRPCGELCSVSSTPNEEYVLPEIAVLVARNLFGASGNEHRRVDVDGAAFHLG